MGDEANSLVWVRDKDQAWLSASVVDKRAGDDGSTTFVVQTDDDGERQEFTSQSASLAQHADIKLRNVFEDGSMDLTKVNDLTKLTHLHEPAILEALCQRFAVDQIYTYTGPILLAVNPFKQLQLYTPKILEEYYSNGILKSQGIESSTDLGPHVYAVGDNAYRSLVDSGDVISGKGKKNQSILVSGESGAGKTESTKFIMRYLATVAGAKAKEAEDSGAHAIADKVLQSNPILEAFGNARTIRNDNSSRFGKFIEMQFDGKGTLVGARIVTYLLEKVRLAHQAADERNFHVFYQIYGAEADELERWKVPAKEDCAYINQSGCYERKDGVDDDDQHKRMLHAMDVMQFTDEEREHIFMLVSAVMNLAGLSFDDQKHDGEDGSGISRDGLSGTSLDNLAALLALDVEAIQKGLCTRDIKVGVQTFTKPLSAKDALEARDALSKDIYSRMFNWVVKRVNHSIEHITKIRSFIGVLDIFGFEVFDTNSFEQLCINYANETLQQQFNQFVFKLEQKEYEKENITWSFIDFPDNQACLNLIEGKPVGLLALLDEQCLFPKGNDISLASKLYEHLEKEDRFAVTRKHKVAYQFVIEHYAGNVCYDTEGFCNKNKDQLRQELLELLYTSDHGLIKTLYPPVNDAKAKRSSIRLVTVGTQFKNQLNSLLTTIKETAPHYIRCLKPNDSNCPGEVVRPRLVDQLRYGGVLEAVKVARAGYPTRLPLGSFVERYFMLAGGVKVTDSKVGDGKKACNLIVSALELVVEEHYQVGRTKVFLRKDAYETIESKRAAKLKWAAKKITAILHGAKDRKLYIRMRKAVLVIQTNVRGKLARNEALARRQHNSSVKILAIVRGYLARKHFQRKMRAILSIQSFRRKLVARRIFEKIKYEHCSVVLQSFFRSYLAKKNLRYYKSAAVVIQCCYRSSVARALRKQYRIEAKQVGNLQTRVDDLQGRVRDLEVKLAKERELRKAAEAALNDQQSGGGGDAMPQTTSSESTGPAKSSTTDDAALGASVQVAELQRLLAESKDAIAQKDRQVAEERAKQEAKNQELDAIKLELNSTQQLLQAEQSANANTAPSAEEVDLAAMDSEKLMEQAHTAMHDRELAKAKIDIMQKQLDEQKGLLESTIVENQQLRSKMSVMEEDAATAPQPQQQTNKSQSELEQEVESLREQLAKSQKLAAKLATAGGVTVAATSASNASSDNGNSSRELEALQVKFADLEAERDQYRSMVKQLEEEIAQSTPQVEELALKLHKSEMTITSLEESLTANIAQMCDSENRANETHNECVQLKREKENLSDKISAMETLAEQASGVKIALARRLEQLILENRQLRQSKADLEDKLEYFTETNRLLTSDVKETRKQLHDVAAKAHQIIT